METVINFFLKWIDLISGVFVEHTLAAALMTLVGVGAFIHLEKGNRFRDTTQAVKNSFLVLIGWAITVPILGWLLDILRSVLGVSLNIISFLYEKFEQQPILVICLAVICAVAPIAWTKIKRIRTPSLPVHIAASVILTLVLTALLVPIFNLFTPEGSEQSATQQSHAADPLSVPPSAPLQVGG